ncbi:MAG: dephospho-CoA kinase [Candidatus Omnitrophica bacterium]|nr:dephospho-CoA kinase [Candidatus Omnitrophota bacterium]
MKPKKTRIIPLRKPKRVSLLVGLTGGFGSGKSTAARYFRLLGAQVIDSDQLVHEALKPGTPTYDAVCDHFGRKKILGAQGNIDRKKLARIVFENQGKRKILESIVHPYVFSEIERAAKTKSGLLILEVPLLFETHFNEKMDANIVVWSSEKNQMARLRKRTGATPSEVRARMKAQMPLARKKTMADFVINNGGSLKETKNQVLEVWKQLKSMMKKEKA